MLHSFISSLQKIIGNNEVEIKTDIKLPNNRPELFIYDKKKEEITLIEVGITNQDILQTVESEKNIRSIDQWACNNTQS